LQALAQGLATVGGRRTQAIANQLLTAGDQGTEPLVESLELLVNTGRGNPHQHFADLGTIGVDRRFDEIHRWIATRSIEHLIQRSLTLALLDQGLVDRILPVQVAGKVLALGIVINHEQHVGVALGAAGEVGEHRHIVVPDRPRGDRCQQLGHVVGRILEVFLQGGPQLLLFVLQPRGKARAQALTGAAGEALQAPANILPGLLQLAGELAAVFAQTLPQVGLQSRHGAAGQRNGHQHLHQKGDTKGNKHRPQEAAS